MTSPWTWRKICEWPILPTGRNINNSLLNTVSLESQPGGGNFRLRVISGVLGLRGGGGSHEGAGGSGALVADAPTAEGGGPGVLLEAGAQARGDLGALHGGGGRGGAHTAVAPATRASAGRHRAPRLELHRSQGFARIRLHGVGVVPEPGARLEVPHRAHGGRAVQGAPRATETAPRVGSLHLLPWFHLEKVSKEILIHLQRARIKKVTRPTKP